MRRGTLLTSVGMLREAVPPPEGTYGPRRTHPPSTRLNLFVRIGGRTLPHGEERTLTRRG